MSTAIILPEERRTAVSIAPAQADSSILAVISRVAADPNCDTEKMERLLIMHERMQAKAAEQAFNAAMAQMQCEIPTVYEGAVNLHTKNSYATLDDINHTLKPIMRRHGFAVTFKVDQAAAGINVTGILMHSAGHREQTTMFLPLDKGPGRNDVQAVGSSTTYGKRYVMCALLNITTGEVRDDDGAGATNDGNLREQVVIDILERVSEAKDKDELSEVWKAAVSVLRAAGDTAGYERVKAVVAAKGKEVEVTA
ncbi:ERF family protein [Pseudomonas sp. Leaf127]|uniref:ERF family protein n=1 Tax=Pseudomonas sp. Leaf127 TaxID=1736267 RepID=UPI0007036C36|nr:ERF family protein [Pseudomonas sp. Leaf127]KQQ60109.1 ERF family protein [Pseudomonas sp. Leaf127]